MVLTSLGNCVDAVEETVSDGQYTPQPSAGQTPDCLLLMPPFIAVVKS